jgi:hypothetical protein
MKYFNASTDAHNQLNKKKLIKEKVRLHRFNPPAQTPPRQNPSFSKAK